LERAGCQQAWIVNSANFGGQVAETTANNIDAARCGVAPDVCANPAAALP
ncbi:MAG: hypothetical protein HY975_00580, partial [Candidatus Kerfeldbacteria bacterium]|nr:hypothetical protein [Candidatus Kerfeldbacteria bacterium]